MRGVGRAEVSEDVHNQMTKEILCKKVKLSNLGEIIPHTQKRD